MNIFLVYLWDKDFCEHIFLAIYILMHLGLMFMYVLVILTFLGRCFYDLV